MSGNCPICPINVEGPHFADRTEQPTAPRTRRTPDTCSKCGAPGYRIVDDSGDGSVRFERAAASVPAPEQDEAISDAGRCVCGTTSEKHTGDCHFGWHNPNTCPHYAHPEQDEAVRHPRTYSLVGTPHLFLVTDDESGINIGYANKIGGPLVAPALATPPSRRYVVEPDGKEGGM